MARDDAKPIRSLLYTPGDQEQRIADNAASGADALFLDLEEPRTPCSEETRVRARKLVREFLDTAPTGPGSPRYFVRVQPVASGMILAPVVLHFVKSEVSRKRFSESGNEDTPPPASS